VVLLAQTEEGVDCMDLLLTDRRHEFGGRDYLGILEELVRVLKKATWDQNAVTRGNN
jgi:hypothetical protein